MGWEGTPCILKLCLGKSEESSEPSISLVDVNHLSRSKGTPFSPLLPFLQDCPDVAFLAF